MHIITKAEDLKDLPLTFAEVKGILTTRLQGFLEQYHVNDIASFGAFILIESPDEINDYQPMQLSEPITAERIEWIEAIHTVNGSVFYNVCVVRDNIFAVNIYIPDSVMNGKIKNLIERNTNYENN